MLDFLFPKVPQVNADDVKKAMEDGKSFVILDVRTPQEYAKSHIEGSINVPVDEINNIDKTLPDKSTKIYVHCLSGSRSVMAVAEMVKLGYSQVFDMKNGLLAWRIKKYPEIN
jgi:rhodanese-related sulfurtransferase